MLLTGIAPQSYPYAHQPRESGLRIYDEFAHPATCLFMSDDQVSDMENGYLREEQQPFVSVMVQQTSNHTPYGTFPASEEGQNNSIPIEDVQKFRSWLNKVKITLPLSCIQTFFNSGIKLLSEIIKKFESKGEILANQESNASDVQAEDIDESTVPSLEITGLVAEVMDKLDRQMELSAEQGCDKYQNYQRGAAALNSAYNLYCVTRNIQTPLPAFFSFLIMTYSFASPLLLVSEEKASKEPESKLEKANKGKATTDGNLDALEESVLPQDKESTKDHRYSRNGCLSVSARESFSRQPRSRQSSVNSNLSDITVLNA